jgi:hypothetical protein
MFTATLREILSDSNGELLQHHNNLQQWLFVVREGSTVFWVGEASNVRRRVGEHLGGYPSALGKLILGNVPSSFDWIFEIWTLADCKPYLPTGTALNVETGKRALVAHYQPCLNVADNLRPTPLPARYQPARSDTPSRDEIFALLGLVPPDQS